MVVWYIDRFEETGLQRKDLWIGMGIAGEKFVLGGCHRLKL